MTDFLALPSARWAEEGLALVRETESQGVIDHSIRTFLYARLVAKAEGLTKDATYHEDLVYAACLLHDLGIGSLAKGATRFEVEGADFAAALLTRHGMPANEVDAVWEAITLHSSHGIADRIDHFGHVTYLTYRGVFVDASSNTAGLDEDGVRQIQTSLPRPANDRSIVDAIADHAELSPAAAPPHTIGADLLRDRRLAAEAAN